MYYTDLSKCFCLKSVGLECNNLKHILASFPTLLIPPVRRGREGIECSRCPPFNYTCVFEFY